MSKPLSLEQQIDKTKLPKHIAIIMDGNGRWAKKRLLPRVVGHEYGVKSVRKITEAAAEIGIKHLTLYTFSTENWNRPALEVNAIMALLVRTIRKEVETLQKNNIRLCTIGDTDALPIEALKELNEAKKLTAQNSRMDLILALNYSARWDIGQAIKNIVHQAKSSQLDESKIDESTIGKFLSTSPFPNPELLIRTSGEYRLSNFMLWELAYSEFYFSPINWPDFDKKDLYEAILDYQNRERRFGKTSEQIKDNNNV